MHGHATNLPGLREVLADGDEGDRFLVDSEKGGVALRVGDVLEQRLLDAEPLQNGAKDAFAVRGDRG